MVRTFFFYSIFFLANNAFADNAQTFVHNLITKGINIVNQAIPFEEKSRQFSELLEKHFFTEDAARSALGREWKVLSKENQKAFTEAYRKRLLSIYATEQRISLLKGKSFLVDKNIKEQHIGRHTLYTVKTRFFNEGEDPQTQSVIVEWTVLQPHTNWGVFDVVIEGISQRISDRRNFSSLWKKHQGNIRSFLHAVAS